MTDDLYPRLVVFDDGTVVADRSGDAPLPLGPETSRMFRISVEAAQQFRDELLRAGAVDRGRLEVGQGSPDLVFGVLVEIGSGLTKVGTSSETPATDPLARDIPALLAAFDRALANPLPVPSELAHQHLIYQTGEGFMRTKCFPIGMQRARAIRRALTNTMNDYFWVGGRRVYDVAVVTAYGRPPRRFPPFDDPTCKRVPSQPIVIRH